MANLDFSYPAGGTIELGQTTPVRLLNMQLPLTPDMMANGIRISGFTIDMDLIYLQKAANVEVITLPDNTATKAYATEAEAEKARTEINNTAVTTTTAATADGPEETIEESTQAERIATTVLVKTKKKIKRRFLPRGVQYIVRLRAAGAQYQTVIERTTTAPQRVERLKAYFGDFSREALHLEAELRNPIVVPPETTVEVEILIQLSNAIASELLSEQPLSAQLGSLDPLLEPEQPASQGVKFHFPSVI